MPPTSHKTAPHYTWGTLCDGWHLLDTPNLSVIEERMPPATQERRHRHALARQFFYILSGQLTLEADGTHHTLSPGSGLEIPPGAPHQALNRSAQDVRFLVISQPHAHGDRTDV